MRQFIVVASLCAIAAPLAAQMPDTQAMLSAQREAMKPLVIMDGAWRGTAWTMTPQGRHTLVQTERSGAFLDGTVRIIEGKGYEPDGSVSFNALAVISYNQFKKSFEIKSYAMGFSGAFPLTLKPDGYVWETPAGPGAIMRYTATIKGDDWLEIGERVAPGAAPVQTFEMKLKRIGKTDWPVAGAVPAK